MANFLFYLMAVLAVLASAGVVLARNPIASVLSLLGSFFCLATIYLLAGFQFIAAAQILVYAGAIMVLFLFVIMLLNLADAKPLEKIGLPMFKRRKSAITLAVAAAILMLGLTAITTTAPAPAASTVPSGGIDSIRESSSSSGLAPEMFGRYLLPFEAVSMLLLATAVAVLVLAKRNRGERPSEPAAHPGEGGEAQ